MVEFSPEDGQLYRLGFAGDTFNTAWAARQLMPSSVDVRYVTTIGMDWISDAMLAFITTAGIDTSSVRRIPNLGPGLYATRIVNGERTFAYWRKNSAATQLADDACRLAAALEGATFVLISGITLAILSATGRHNIIIALERARAMGARVAFDPNYRAKLWKNPIAARRAFERVYPLVDIALPSLEDEAELFGDTSSAATIARMTSHGIREIVVKNGPDPAFGRYQACSFEVPSEHVVGVVDTSGAGDAFNAGYLTARMAGIGAAAAVGAGHRAASIAVRTRGALIPTRLA